MLKIRLTRRGKRNKAFFRLVVAEHTSPIKGKFIEALGFLNPHTKENSLKSERIKYWMERGAQCSDSAHNMLVKAGILKGPKRAVKMKPSSAKASEDEKKDSAEEKKEETPKKEEIEVPEKKEKVKEEVKIEEKVVPEKVEKAEEPKKEAPKPARIAAPADNEVATSGTQSVAGGDEKVAPKEAEQAAAGEEKKPVE